MDGGDIGAFLMDPFGEHAASLALRPALENVTVHDPAMLLARLLPCSHDVWADLRKRAGYDDLIGHAEIRAPPDVQAFRIERLECRAAVEHHHHGIDALRPAGFAQAASSRDQK